MYLLQANLCLFSACSSGTKGKGPGQQEEGTRAGGRQAGWHCRPAWLPGLSAGLYHVIPPPHPRTPGPVLCANAA